MCWVHFTISPPAAAGLSVVVQLFLSCGAVCFALCTDSSCCHKSDVGWIPASLKCGFVWISVQKIRQTGKRHLFWVNRTVRHAPQSFLLILRKLESVNMTRLLYKKKKLADGQTAERYLVKLANTYSNEAKLKFGIWCFCELDKKSKVKGESCEQEVLILTLNLMH